MSAVSIQLDGGLLLFDVYVQPWFSRTELKGVYGSRVQLSATTLAQLPQ